MWQAIDLRRGVSKTSGHEPTIEFVTTAPKAFNAPIYAEVLYLEAVAQVPPPTPLNFQTLRGIEDGLRTGVPEAQVPSVLFLNRGMTQVPNKRGVWSGW